MMHAKRVLALLLALLCLVTALPALAEDVCELTPADVRVETERSFVRVRCELGTPGNVTVSVSGPGGLMYACDYGEQTGTFVSDDIYLPLEGRQTSYEISVNTPDGTQQFTVRRKLPRLMDSMACTAGYPLSALTGHDGWLTVTLVDLAALERQAAVVPVVAAGTWQLGTASFSAKDGRLTVKLQLSREAAAVVRQSEVQVARNTVEAANLGKRSYDGIVADVGEEIDLRGVPCAAVYVRLNVDFDADPLPDAESTALEGQEELWQLLQQYTDDQSVG